MFVFTGFNTMSGIQTLIFNSATNPDSGGFVPGFQGNGFIASAVIYGVFSIASWLAPSVVAWRGPRFAMFVAGLLYAQYIGQLLYPNTYMLYISAAIIGLGAPVIWTAQGNFLAICSDPETISRNSGIVWAMLQVSGLIGNIFAFFMFNGQEYISSSVRTTVGIVLLAITLNGIAETGKLGHIVQQRPGHQSLKGLEGLLCPLPHHRHAVTFHHLLLHRPAALDLVRCLPHLSWLLWGARYRKESLGDNSFDLNCCRRGYRRSNFWLLWPSHFKARSRPNCSLGFCLVNACLLPHLLGNPQYSKPQ